MRLSTRYVRTAVVGVLAAAPVLVAVTATSGWAEPVRTETPNPQSLALSCHTTASGPLAVECNWNQSAAAGWAHYVLLRSRPGQGRVLAWFGDVTKTHAVDTSFAPCVKSAYLVDSLDSANHVIEHSNFVTIDCAPPSSTGPSSAASHGR